MNTVNSCRNIHISVIARICSQAAPLREWLVVRLARTMRMGGIALKMGVLFERSEFRPFSNDGHSQRNGSFGRPPFAMPKRFARNQRFRLSAYLDSFFFDGTKKNGHYGYMCNGKNIYHPISWMYVGNIFMIVHDKVNTSSTNYVHRWAYVC